MEAVPSPSGRGDLVEVNPPVPLLAGPVQMCRNLWAHRHLLSSFVQRDLRLRYRDTAFGYFWSLLEPLLLSGVFFLLYVILAGTPEPRVPLWIIVGVITWQLFSKTLTGTVTSLTKNDSIIKQAYFPRELFAATGAGSQLVLACASLLVAIPFMIYFGITPSVHLLMVPAGLVMASTLALGIGLSFACLNVANRDVEHLFKFLTRAGMFLSPVMWTVDMPKSRAGVLEFLFYNPMATPLTMVRNGIDGRPLGIDPWFVAYAVGFCALSLLVGATIFRRFEAAVVKRL